MLFAFSFYPGIQTEYVVKHTTSRDSNTKAAPSKKRCQTETTKTICISASHEKQNWLRHRNQLRTHKNIEPTAPRLPKRDTYTHRKDRRGRKKTYNSNILFPFSSATKMQTEYVIHTRHRTHRHQNARSGTYRQNAWNLPQQDSKIMSFDGEYSN